MKFGKKIEWYYKYGDNEFIVNEEKLSNVPKKVLENLVKNNITTVEGIFNSLPDIYRYLETHPDHGKH